MPNLVSVNKLAADSGVSPRTIKRHAKRAGIPLLYLGSVAMIDADAWGDHLSSLPTERPVASQAAGTAAAAAGRRA